MLHHQPSDGRIEDGLREVHLAGDGVMTLSIVSSASAGALVTAVMAGDVAARTILTAADQLLRRIERRSRAWAMPCALCDDAALWRKEAPAAIGLLTPFGVECASVVVGLAICASCVGDRSDREIATAAVQPSRT